MTTAGENLRRQVMGESFVDKALSSDDQFTQQMQQYINEHAWGSTWQRSGIDLKTRSLITVAMLAAMKAPQELKGHVRGALNNGATTNDVLEVILHSAVYCGTPTAQEALRAAKEVLDL